MKKYGFVAIMLTVILLVSVAGTTAYVKVQEKEEKGGSLTVVTSFYPMYIAAMNVIGDYDRVTLENLSQPQTGCLHDFQLTPQDMKLLSGADVFIINGGGIESFLADVAEAYPQLRNVSACQKLELLGAEDADGSDEHAAHDGEDEQDMHDENDMYDGQGGEDAHDEHDGHAHSHAHSHGDSGNAHAWMSVADYRVMVSTIAEGLCQADPAGAAYYQANAAAYDRKLQLLQQEQETLKEELAGRSVILFHEAYAYVAEEYGMEVIATLDLDEERQVSAGEIAEVLRAIDDGGAELILAEELYGSSMASTIQQERDIPVLYLDPLNRGEYTADSYLAGMESNMSLLRSYLEEKP